MNCLAEAVGLALPGNGTIPAARWTNKEKGQWEVNPLRIDLIKKISDYNFGENNKENLEILKGFQREWMEIGHVPIKEKEKIDATTG